MRVLIIDNDPRSSLAISYMLKASAIMADCVDSARRAVELCRRYRYDILLLDLTLLDPPGDQLVHRLRAIDGSRPMLVLSRVLRPRPCTTVLDAGPGGFLEKPFERGELLSRIHPLLDQRKRAAERSAIQFRNTTGRTMALGGMPTPDRPRNALSTIPLPSQSASRMLEAMQ